MSPTPGVAASLALLLAVVACAPRTPPVHPVAKMAPFDLDCPVAQIKLVNLDADTMGATGCGKRAKHVKTCHMTVFGGIPIDECRWVQN